MKRLFILGAGGYGRTIADMASQLGEYYQISFLDDKSSGENILGTCEEVFRFLDDRTEVYPAFGSGEYRSDGHGGLYHQYWYAGGDGLVHADGDGDGQDDDHNSHKGDGVQFDFLCFLLLSDLTFGQLCSLKLVAELFLAGCAHVIISSR